MEKLTQIFKRKSKEGSQCICWSAILIDSFFGTGSNYYPQVLLEECKYVVKEKKDTRLYNWQHRNFFRRFW